MKHSRRIYLRNRSFKTCYQKIIIHRLLNQTLLTLTTTFYFLLLHHRPPSTINTTRNILLFGKVMLRYTAHFYLKPLVTSSLAAHPLKFLQQSISNIKCAVIISRVFSLSALLISSSSNLTQKKTCFPTTHSGIIYFITDGRWWLMETTRISTVFILFLSLTFLNGIFLKETYSLQ